MRLHTNPVTPNHRRTAVFLAEKGVELPTVEVDLQGGENIQEPFLTKNPFGRIPVLELDDGTFISESVAICRYFEETHPEPALFGTTPLERAQVEMWNRRAELNLMMNVAQAFRNITGFFKDRETCVAEWGHVCAKVANEVVPVFDARLAETEYLAGDQFSIADITLATTLAFGKSTKVLEISGDLASLARWREQVTSRPSFG